MSSRLGIFGGMFDPVHKGHVAAARFAVESLDLDLLKSCWKFLAPDTPIWVDFWIFSDQAQLLDPESVASKEPRSGLVA